MTTPFRFLLGWTTLLAATHHLSAEAASPNADPKPLVAFWQLPPSAESSSDYPSAGAPRAVVYEDGTTLSLVLPSSREPDLHRAALARPLFVTRKLTAAELGSWYEDVLTIATQTDLQRNYTLDPDPAASPGALFYFFAAGRAFSVGVRGLEADSLNRFGAPQNPEAGYVPSRLLRIYQDLQRVANGTAREWRPPQVEVHFQPAADGRAATVDWPTAWPFGSTIILSGDARDHLATLLPPPLSQHVVRVAGRNLAVTYRFVFPGERAWRATFEENVRALSSEDTRAHRDADTIERERAALREAFRQAPSHAEPPK